MSCARSGATDFPLFLKHFAQGHKTPDAQQGFIHPVYRLSRNLLREAEAARYGDARHQPFRATCSRHMLSILRFILVVGVIFYYSPVRQKGEGTSTLEAFFSPTKSEPATSSASPLPVAPAAPSSGQLETMWKALPDTAKQAVVDKVLTTSGLTSPKPADTLRPEDREPTSKPRT
jgi:hypothetical protein